MKGQLNMLINLGYFKGILRLQALRKLLKIQKEMFVIELEAGNEVLIPKGLSQSDLPLSFRYYDSVLRIIKKNLSDKRKQFFKVKKNLVNSFGTENQFVKFL